MMQFECNQLHSEFTHRWVRALAGDRRPARRVSNSPGTHQRDLPFRVAPTSLLALLHVAHSETIKPAARPIIRPAPAARSSST
jgi:hypothetical protein